MRPVIVWIRRDLRVADNAALYQAAKTGAPVIPIFIFDTTLIRQAPSDGASFDFQAEALKEFRENIERLGGKLVVRHGNVLDVHRKIIAETKPAGLFFNQDYEPLALERDKGVERLYASNGIEVIRFKDMVLHGPDEVMTLSGKPFVVFTPYARAWKNLPKAAPFPKPRRIQTPSIKSDPIVGAQALRRKIRVEEPAIRGGEREARSQWKRFLDGSLADYDRKRNVPGIRGTSRMSGYLRFGCISPRTMYEDCMDVNAKSGNGEGKAKFIDELIWREFYQSVLFHFPRLVNSNFRSEFDRFRWSTNENNLRAWQKGLTGYPLVDAGMRELNRTGWMHNRVRMVVASFLTKHLMIDWQLGQRYFEERLLDIETASNNGGWQWAASTGVDPRPLRIFNPTLQAERYDPEGFYIRQYVPELAKVPNKFIHEPSLMPPALQKEIGVTIGRDYPGPMVNHREASQKFRELYLQMKGSRPKS